MPVYKDNKGNWYVKYSVYKENKRHYVTKRGFNTKREAVEWENTNKFNAKEYVSSATFEELKNAYIESKQANDDTIKAYKSMFDMYCSDFYKLEYNYISKIKINNWKNKISELSLGTSTKNTIISRFKSVCTFAYKVYDLEDKGKHLEPFKKSIDEHKEMNVWTVEEFNKFINHVDNYVYQVFFRLLFATGMRRGEALALQKTDIENNIITINKSIKHFENGFLPTKNANSKRKIAIDTNTLKYIKPLLKHSKGFIFGDYQSLGITSVQRTFTTAIKKSGVKPIRLHDLRHSHATLLINNGVNIVAVSKRLGHSDINMTLKVYTHLLDKTNEELLIKLNKIY